MIQTTWDFSPLYSGLNDPAIDRDIASAVKLFTAFNAKWKPRIAELGTSEVLLEALKEYETLLETGPAGKTLQYAVLLKAKDSTDKKILEFMGKIERILTDNASLETFFSVAVGKLPEDTQRKVLAFEKLQPYRKELTEAFEYAKHLLTEAEENIIVKLSPVIHAWDDLSEDLISKKVISYTLEDKKERKTLSGLIPLLQSPKKEVRDAIAKKVYPTIAKFKDVATVEMNAIANYQLISRKMKGFEFPDSSRCISDDIDRDVVHTMLDAVSARNSIAHRYYQALAKYMKLSQLEQYERSIELPISKKFSFEESVKRVITSFAAVDQESADITSKFFENGQVDVYPAKGKRGGAFCMPYTTKTPTYIMLNFVEKLREVATIAHECGHGIHFELMKKNVPERYFGCPMATAEVASTFYESIVSESVMKELSGEEKVHMLFNSLSDDIATIFRQVAVYKFEYDFHMEYQKKSYVAKQTICKLFKKRMAEYMGPAVSQKKWGDTFWVIWGHIRNPFYTYSYASGQLISNAMFKKVSQDKSFMRNVKEFLSAGKSASPKDLFAKMGIDITQKEFWNDGLDEIERKVEMLEKSVA